MSRDEVNAKPEKPRRSFDERNDMHQVLPKLQIRIITSRRITMFGFSLRASVRVVLRLYDLH